VVLLVWTDGQVRLPRALRLWRQAGPAKDALALEFLSLARNRLTCHPPCGLFDLGGPSATLRQRVGAPALDLHGRWGPRLQPQGLHVCALRGWFFHAWMPVVGRTCRTRAVSRMPLACRALSTMGRVRSGA
jgi:hypothetical protein